MKTRPKTGKKNNQLRSGFTLLETMVSILVLSVILGAVFSQIRQAQSSYRIETNKLDLTQQQGQFLDQFTRDLHQAGFPTAISLGPANAGLAAAGLTALTPTSLTMEGDLDGSGVKTVSYYYCDGVAVPCPAAVACPCLMRSVVPKGAGAVPFVAVQNVLPLPAGGGIFTAYDNTGKAMLFPVTLSSVKAVGVTFSLQGNPGLTAIQNTMTGMARLPNN